MTIGMSLSYEFFLACMPGPHVAGELHARMQPYLQTNPAWDWKPADYYHVTLAKIGTVPANLVEALTEVIAGARLPPFQAPLTTIAKFNKMARGHLDSFVIHAGFDQQAASGFADIRARLLRRLMLNNMPTQTDPFYTPHLTVAKARKTHAPAVDALLRGTRPFKPIEWQIGGYYLGQRLPLAFAQSASRSSLHAIAIYDFEQGRIEQVASPLRVPEMACV